MGSGIIGDAVKEEIERLIEEKLNEHNDRLTKDDINDIVTSLIPDMDKLVSKQVKKHFILLAQYALETFGGNLEDA